MAEEFDNYAGRYEELLDDPIRQRFAPGSEFFATRKWILIRDFFARQKRSLTSMRWLDVGCGKGELLRLGKSSFSRVAGCDMSEEMMSDAKDVEVTLQTDPKRLPYADGSFDFVTAVCVFHHVDPPYRDGLIGEMKRILAPGGVMSIIEHNPWNPATRLIVSRTPVDQNAILLRAGETSKLMRDASMSVLETEFFLYLPESLYNKAPGFEAALKRIPFGGQYATFSRKDR